MEPAFLPDPAAMRDHLSWLTDVESEALPDLRVEIAWGAPETGPRSARTYRIDQIKDAVNFAACINAQGCNVYVGSTLKRADASANKRTRGEDAVLATSLPIDIDGNFVAGARRLTLIAKPQLLVLTGRVPETRGQLWLRTSPTEDMDLWADVNRASVFYSGGDRNALGTHRLMRLAGSVSYPPLKKQARGYVVELTCARYFDAPTYDLDELLERLPPVEPNPAQQRKSRLAKSHPRLPVNRTNVALVQSMLDALPDKYADEYVLWIETGFALHDFDNGPVGLALWKNFSARFPDKAKNTDFETVWSTFDRGYEGKKIGLAWLRWHAQAHGWRAACQWDRLTIAS